MPASFGPRTMLRPGDRIELLVAVAAQVGEGEARDPHSVTSEPASRVPAEPEDVAQLLGLAASHVVAGRLEVGDPPLDVADERARDRLLGRQRPLRQAPGGSRRARGPAGTTPGAPARSRRCRGRGASGRTPITPDVEDEVRVRRPSGGRRRAPAATRSSPHRSRAARTSSCRPTRWSTSTVCWPLLSTSSVTSSTLPALSWSTATGSGAPGVRVGDALGLGDLRASASARARGSRGRSRRSPRP